MSPKADGRRHTLADLYHERTRFNFIERSWRWAVLCSAELPEPSWCCWMDLNHRSLDYRSSAFAR